MAKKTDTAIPTFEMPKFDGAQMEVPAAFREIAEKSLSQAKDAYEKSKLMAEEATDVLEDTYAASTKGTLTLMTKAIDQAKASTDASFEFTKSIFGAKSVAELVELNTAFARSQFEAMTAQSKELTELATKIANDAAAPMKAATEKALAQVKKSA